MKKITYLTLLPCIVFAAFTSHADNISNLDDSHNINKLPKNEQNETQFIVDLGWDSEYISEGRNNLDKGGITWGTLAVQRGDLNIYATGGRADSQDYTEWNFGLEYAIAISDTIDVSIGYQRLEFYGDEPCSDNELFSSLTYQFNDWLIPSLAYTYSTEAGGYFVEASIHSPWELSDGFTVTPYITQAFDFQYVTEEHNGANHFQFGIEAEYIIMDQLVISGHFSHTLAQEDIKLEAKAEENEGSLEQTYAGIHLTWNF
ncbi:hypothetical protein FM038_000760 [Shewanella eurypsychrophilus]|uniref:Uncharacterized protein n=1 Tax=Shewanella eurypsychrophilus TaxID=2593656 RepID=A0ABX6V0U1_9GAMM|nr:MULTISPECIES: hypothetical protein [Shewanella]QFU20548.1 hypothetical protein FS418_00750 [Shewanella sp. YLB-09]QFU20829.1 hypothetical protein FS418_02360 [Shewanella sp. YLB-09]QPG56118.1 hypothetical protein FM038_000760 [Shewanella eurypsychrophilus]